MGRGRSWPAADEEEKKSAAYLPCAASAAAFAHYQAFGAMGNYWP